MLQIPRNKNQIFTIFNFSNFSFYNGRIAFVLKVTKIEKHKISLSNNTGQTKLPDPGMALDGFFFNFFKLDY